ncbi:hypothetical protein [Burkholderia gladioli]|uniref:hypothetical protein n=1 Tax=Burkholderia gladioli TaxID=28095 RepID=UPI00163EB3DA|nr:hypothetical protein [Burkholderia gladioli]
MIRYLRSERPRQAAAARSDDNPSNLSNGLDRDQYRFRQTLSAPAAIAYRRRRIGRRHEKSGIGHA